MGLINKAIGVYKRYGFSGFMTKLNEKMQSPMRSYGKRVKEFMPTTVSTIRILKQKISV